jgi:hypothetical protein
MTLNLREFQRETENHPSLFVAVITQCHIDGDTLTIDDSLYSLLTMQHGLSRVSISTKALTFLQAMRTWKSAGFPLPTRRMIHNRLTICKACEQFLPGGNLMLGECKKCGCTKLKTFLATEKCPLGKWPA